jgi:hypothetical protein
MLKLIFLIVNNYNFAVINKEEFEIYKIRILSTLSPNHIWSGTTDIELGVFDHIECNNFVITEHTSNEVYKIIFKNIEPLFKDKNASIIQFSKGTEALYPKTSILSNFDVQLLLNKFKNILPTNHSNSRLQINLDMSRYFIFSVLYPISEGFCISNNTNNSWLKIVDDTYIKLIKIILDNALIRLRRIVKALGFNVKPIFQELVFLSFNKTWNLSKKQTKKLRSLNISIIDIYGSIETSYLTFYNTLETTIFLKESFAINPYYNNTYTIATGINNAQDLFTLDSMNKYRFIGRLNNSIITNKVIITDEIENNLKNLKYIKDAILIKRNHELFLLIFPDLNECEEDNINLSELHSILNSYQITLFDTFSINISSILIMGTDFKKNQTGEILKFFYKQWE